MPSINSIECAGRFAVWLGKKSSLDAARTFAKEIGYNDSPFFGARKARVRLLGELLMLNVALAIIDPILASLGESDLKVLEQRDSQFTRKYEQRLTEYFKILHESQAALGLSFTMLESLGLPPINNFESQLKIASYVAETLKEAVEILDRVTNSPEQSLQAPHGAYDPRILNEFRREITTWPPDKAKAALLIVRATISGDGGVIERLQGGLTLTELRSVRRVVERISAMRRGG